MYIVYSIFAVLFLSSTPSFADCVTGYACSIEQLKSDNEIDNKLNEYYQDKFDDISIFPNTSKDLKYNDFFPFTFVLNSYNLKY